MEANGLALYVSSVDFSYTPGLAKRADEEAVVVKLVVTPSASSAMEPLKVPI